MLDFNTEQLLVPSIYMQRSLPGYPDLVCAFLAVRQLGKEHRIGLRSKKHVGVADGDSESEGAVDDESDDESEAELSDDEEGEQEEQLVKPKVMFSAHSVDRPASADSTALAVRVCYDNCSSEAFVSWGIENMQVRQLLK